MAFVCPLYMDSPSQILRDLTGREEEKNPVTKLYNRLFRADVGRWVCACAVIGLSAGLLSQHPGPMMVAVAAYNLSIAGLHFFIPKVPVSPMGQFNPKPPLWYMAFLAISISMWMSAFICMFVVRRSRSPAEVYQLEQRDVRGGFTDANTEPLDVLQSITIACGCVGILASMFCFYQCYIVHQLFTTSFRKSEMREGYRRGSTKPTKSEKAVPEG